MRNFRQALQGGKVIIFDGAMGSVLQSLGLKPGQSPEEFGVKHPELIADIHIKYAQAGARVVTTNTFGATSFKLPPDLNVFQVNETMARTARQAMGEHVFVAGSVGPTGRMIEPLGRTTFREVVAAYKEQIQGLVAGGIDLVLGETHFDLAEARAVVVAAREVCALPIAMSMAFEQGVSLTGTTPEVFALTMRNMGVDLVGSNCSAGPEELIQIAQRLLAVCDLPVLIQPNAGLPELIDGHTIFRLAPQPFATTTATLVEQGVTCLGGCCGTTPEHIQVLHTLCTQAPPGPRKTFLPQVVVTSRAQQVALSCDLPCKLIGERINPTGKKELTAELQEYATRQLMTLAQEQIALGAHILDVNVGAPMVEEPIMLPLAIKELSRALTVPLCLDSSNTQAMQAGLETYPGSALVNSISGEHGRMEELGPLCRDYGAPFILLPLQGRKLPVTAAERLAIIEALLRQTQDLGIPKHLITIDALALTISSKPQAALACLEVIRYCREQWHIPCTMGLSNISFGLPARELINSTFLAMAMGAGLASCIANPSSTRIQETLASGEVVLGRDHQAESFIAGYAQWTPGQTMRPLVQQTSEEEGSAIKRAIIKGQKDDIVHLLKEQLDQGANPFALVDEEMIPAITTVGEKYEKREYFLPQLLLCAETMQVGFESIKHLLSRQEQEAKATIIMATVEGDIHDIGKNIVCLMLKNYGYQVIDLGKDVKAQDIVAAAIEHKAALVGLSALMTTTMVRMEDTVRLLQEKKLPCQVMVGGAVVSQDFADRIGAHGYADDAVAAVRVATALCAKIAQ